jgi:hypothetical protein
MTKEEIDDFMRYWHRLEIGRPEKGESLSDFLEKFAKALSFKVEGVDAGNNIYAYVYVEHGGLQIYGDSNKALLFCVRNDNEEDALELYSSLGSVIYSRELSNRPAAILMLKGTKTFEGYCRESPLEFVRLEKKQVEHILRGKKPRWEFS